MVESAGKQVFSRMNPVFVVGLFRSGTSLLYALLNRHPHIALMYECNVCDFPELFSRTRFRRDWRERLEFFCRTFSRHRLAFGDNLRGLENVRTAEDLYRVFAESKDAPLFGEKSPHYCARLRQLAKHYPGCSLILIWRDPVEIHRSIQDAARRSRFFRRRGMLNRLIYYQEQMIHQAAWLARAGARVHHVTYDDLIHSARDTCRGICSFLKIEFDEKMLDLAGADLSAIFNPSQHEHLRAGKIERRRFSGENADAAVIRKLSRYGNRWNRLRHQLFNHQNNSMGSAEPLLPERSYHQLAGRLLWGLDGAKRTLFEFLPLPWLRTYRQVKAWYLAGTVSSRADRQSLLQEFLANKATILLSLAILAGTVVADHVTSFAVSFLPFYMVPAAILTLVIGRRWGTIAAVLATIAWATLQIRDNPYVNPAHCSVWLWDSLMRFLIAEFIVLLLGRIRVEIKDKNPSSD